MSAALDWREEPISRHHDRKAFDCGSADLNLYLDRYARQNHESGGAKTFVAVLPVAPTQVLGYYAISPGSIEFARAAGGGEASRTLRSADLPPWSACGQPCRPEPGGDLLFAAGARALVVAAEVGGVALAIDAKDARAAAWYQRFGALPLLDDPLKLVLPLATLAAAIAHRR